MPKKFRLDAATAKLLGAKDRPSDLEDDPYRNLRDESSGDLETDAAEEVDAMHQAFRDRQAGENDRFRRATDTQHWFAVCFIDREHKEAFIAAVGGDMRRLGDPNVLADGEVPTYVDGHELAKRLGLDITP